MPLLRSLSASFCLIPFLLSPALAGPAAVPVRPAAPLFHGNWCGAGDANRAAPIDALDAACRAHDLCYEKLGRSACECDRAILRATASLVRSPKVAETIRSKAATVNSLFSAALCTETPKLRSQAGKR
ncbi:phospholipase A2 family protein [Microvirga sp. Mcv34]|uniref:phospholipase A2 family protein n=1 Tax=Microvirga sp. Mcv34 TaxID=2926016 RepID=UPI0021C5C0D5|nr:phospholipase A2 family protein [Microvirga sp. Mcv34]